MHLKLNKTNSKIIDPFSHKILFVGIFIFNLTHKHSYFQKSRALENFKRKQNRIISKSLILKHKQAKQFKAECLSQLRSIYEKHQHDKRFFKKKLLFLFKETLIFNSFINRSNRNIYRKFIKKLQKITQIKKKTKLMSFLNI